jgi:hypothetical protein
VVLLQGGQDETGFKFKAVSYEPGSGKVAVANASDAILDNALVGAVAKVVPITSSLEVVTKPPGAVVYVDDRKVGVSPVTAQVLPGERNIRLDLKLHQGIEDQVVVPMRGTAKLEKSLEKVAARIVVVAQPAGTQISIDGRVLGKDRVDRGVQPGVHTIRLSADNFKSFEQTIQVVENKEYNLEKTLEPVSGPAGPGRDVAVARDGASSITDFYNERKSYFYLGFEYDQLAGTGFTSHRFGDEGNGSTTNITSGPRNTLGGTFEFGYFGKYFGLAAIGTTVEFLERSWQIGVGKVRGKTITGSAAACPTGEDDSAGCLPTSISAKVVFANIRFVQPAVRFQIWRFMLFLQAGLELRLGHLTQNAPARYNDGFMVFDLGASGRLGTRFYIVDGFFMYVNYRVAAFFVSPFNSGGVLDADGTTVVKTSPINHGFSGGVGYAF